MTLPATRLPQLMAYVTAVQNPSIAFADPRLRSATVRRDALGMPVASAGGFAIAFQLAAGQHRWAVRCYLKETDRLAERYKAISDFTRSASRPDFFVPIEFAPAGINVDGRRWPLTVMPWVEGSLISRWVDDHKNDPASIEGLQARFAAVVAGLVRSGCAHGDLQHGNILVDDSGCVHLIDYDGMYVPALSGEAMAETGHPNYQHPDRARLSFGPDLDRFSAIVIWSALEVARRRPVAWERRYTGENMVFERRDFTDPAASQILAAMARDDALKDLAARLRQVFGLPADRVPTLPAFIAGDIPTSSRPSAAADWFVSAYPVVDAAAPDLATYAGQRVIVVGKLLDSVSGVTRHGQPYLFLGLGGVAQTMRIVLWSEILGHGAARGWVPPPVGSHVSVTGVLTTFRGSPQVVLEELPLLERISPTGRSRLLGLATTDRPTTSTAAARETIHPGDVVRHPSFGQGTVEQITPSGTVWIRFGQELRQIIATYPMPIVRRAVPRESSPRPRLPVQPAASVRRTHPTPSVTSVPGRPRQPPGLAVGAVDATMNRIYGPGGGASATPASSHQATAAPRKVTSSTSPPPAASVAAPGSRAAPVPPAPPASADRDGWWTRVVGTLRGRDRKP